MSRRALAIVAVVVAAAAAGLLATLTVVSTSSSQATRGSGRAVAARPTPAPPAAAEPARLRGPLISGAGASRPDARGGPDGRVALRRWRVGGRAVTVPFSPNAKVITGEAGKRSFNGSTAWYRTTFRVARTGDYALRFESVQHDARVLIDGRQVLRHLGAYLPFEARLRLTAGRHTVAVHADWRDPERLKAEGWHRSWFNWGGIGREVTLRPLAASELDSPGVVTRLRDGGRTAVVDVEVRVRNRAPARRALAVRGRLGATPLSFGAPVVAPGASAWVRARAVVRNPDLWAPGHAALSTLRLTVPGESGWTSRVGLRELRWDGGRLRLNGKPLQLHGASLQEDAPGRGEAMRPRDMDLVVKRLQAIDANATRTQHPLNPAFLERLDAAGILLWQGIGPVDAPGSWTSDTPAEQRTAVRRVRINVLQARAHPSVMVWNLVNEMARNGHKGGQPEYVEGASRMLRTLDPGRPIALDLWGTHLPDVAGAVYRNVDAIGGTNYTGWYDDASAPAATVTARIRAWLKGLRARFPGKVLVITEFGAEANDENPATAPGGFLFQRDLLERHVDVYESDPSLSGWLAWNLQDFAVTPYFDGGSIREQLPALRLVRGLNQKGLFTYDGRPKPAVEAIRRLSAGG